MKNKPVLPIRLALVLALIVLLAVFAFGQLGWTIHRGDPYAAEPVGIVAQPCIARELPADRAQRQIARAFALSRDLGQLCWYREENARLLAANTDVKLVLMGDSITRGWAEIQPDLALEGIIGRGIGGQTTSQMLLRFRADVIALQPDAVHIMAGTNDIAGNTGALSLDMLQDNYRSMAELAQQHDIEVIFGAIPPATQFFWREGIAPAQTIREVNAWLEAYAQENGFTFIDYHSAMTDAEGGLPEELAPDGVHPNAAGFAVMRGLLDPVVASLGVGK